MVKQLTNEALETIANRFKLLSDPMRLKILHTLGESEMSVGDLVQTIGAGQANVSKHLGNLLDAGIVSKRKEGLNVYYRVQDETIFELCETVCRRLESQYSEKTKLFSGANRE
jgi:DNA-binding transcriptional ArsR family regulator